MTANDAEDAACRCAHRNLLMVACGVEGGEAGPLPVAGGRAHTEVMELVEAGS